MKHYDVCMETVWACVENIRFSSVIIILCVNAIKRGQGEEGGGGENQDRTWWKCMKDNHHVKCSISRGNSNNQEQNNSLTNKIQIMFIV